MDKAVADIVEQLHKLSIKVSVSSKETEPRSRPWPSNVDTEIGKMIAEAMEKVGKDGVITVEEGKSLKTEVEVVEGMQFDRGYLSPYFVTDPTTMEAVLEDAYVLIYEKKISTFKDLVPVLEKVVQTGKPLLDHRRGRRRRSPWRPWSSTSCAAPSRCAAVKAPGYGDRRKAMLEDIADPHRWQADLRRPRHQARERRARPTWARPRRCMIDKDNTTIIEGAGNDATTSRAASTQIRREIAETNQRLRP